MNLPPWGFPDGVYAGQDEPVANARIYKGPNFLWSPWTPMPHSLHSATFEADSTILMHNRTGGFAPSAT